MYKGLQSMDLFKTFDDIDENMTYISRRKKNWAEIVEKLDFAFQPIVNIHTGVCYGFEALLRNWSDAGFESIQDVFNTAYDEERLCYLDLLLREKVIKKFKSIGFSEKIKLFYNIDNRTLLMPDYTQEKIAAIAEKNNFPSHSFCLEISERHDFDTFILHDFKSLTEIKNKLNDSKQDFYKLAIDDFGAGLSGLEMLYHSEPDFIKIDRFFINEISNDSRKKLFVSSILNMAHILGVIVIAEGVETDKEFYACKMIGCDMIQGYLVQKPTVYIEELKEKYDIISTLNKKDKREQGSDEKMISGYLDYIEPIPLHMGNNQIVDMGTVFETFRRNKINSFFPLTNGNGEPLGVIREKDLKEYVYSPYGKDLLKNKAAGNLSDFVSRIPISEINTKVEKILEIFSVDVQSEGILLTDNGRYVGFLSASSLIKLLNEKNIAEARDQNPLTKLPGNNTINQYISEAIENTGDGHIFVYFDFDSFKPFNDIYGFRQGDRAILLFADILKEISNQMKCFIGHIGGDDFYVAYKTSEITLENVYKNVEYIIKRFKHDVQSIYSGQDRNLGYIIAKSRDGVNTRYPLLTVSAGILIIPAGQRVFSLEDMFKQLADLKKKAKKNDSKYVAETFG